MIKIGEIMEERVYLLILGVISCSCCCLDIINIKKIYKQIIFIIILLFALYCGCINFPYSTDYEIYKGYYEYSPNSIDFTINNNLYDYGFLWLNMFIKYYGGNLEDVYFVICIIILMIYYYAFPKFTPYIFLSWYFLFARFFELQNIVQIRQGLAIVIMLFALKFIYERKLIKYIVCILIATLFHKTLLVALLIYPFSKINWTKNKIIIFLLLCIGMYLIPLTNIIFNNLLPLIGVEIPKFEAYQGTSYAETSSLIVIVIRFINVMILSYFLFKVKKLWYYKIFLSMLLLGLLIMCMFSDFDILSGRLSNIFFIAFTFAPLCFLDLVKSLKEKILVTALLMIIGTVFVLKNYVFIIISSGNVGGI